MKTDVRLIKKRWQERSFHPFVRLVSLFAARAFHGGGENDSEDLDFSMGLVLSLLALPGAFYSILLFDKYGSLLQWMHGYRHFDVIAVAVPDEYFLIVLSMVVTGIAALWRWDSIFPDRRDYANLVPLPISTRTIFLANLTAVFLVACVLALDVNLVSGLLFPFVATAGQETVVFFLHFAEVHILVVLVSSLFSFFGVFAVVGLLMAFLPRRIFRRISFYLRGTMIAFLVAMLATSFAVPAMLAQLPHSFVRFLPSVWFVGLCQLLRGRANPALAMLGRLGASSLACLVGLAVVAYGVSYRRYFKRIPESLDVIATGSGRGTLWFFALLDRMFLRTGFQRGGYRFALKTLFRSEGHSLILGGFVGLGLVLASQTLFHTFNGGELRGSAPSAEILSIPLILIYCIILGLRVAFAVPSELHANWIFRFLLGKTRPECVALARKVILTFVLPWVFAVLIPLYVYLWGWEDGLFHGAFVILWASLLADIVLLRFRKIPFTCSHPPFRDSAILVVVSYLLGFYLFVFVSSQFEAWALLTPPRMLLAIPVAAGIWLGLRRVRSDTVECDKQLVFEEKSGVGFEVLDLRA
jgi:hypothetical protein